ncbi:unnamed protein product [Polarella glacialis]|uniref:Uncharacterized protein n=1 Tax=Polarella glacialis TaxID=89957 RepID=A0A813DCC2_POLGL|nr:unnamed protein product [Polarella glacialis]
MSAATAKQLLSCSQCCIGNSRQRLRTALVSFSSLVQSGPPVEKRALRLRELQDLRSLIEDRCVGESWHDQETGQQLRAEDVNLYHLNHFLICPSTVPEGVLMYCPCVDTARARGQAMAQSDSNSAMADQTVGEGEVTGVRGVDGQKWLIVKVCKGRFMKKRGNILIEGHISGRCEDVRPNNVSLSYQEVLRYSKGLLPEAVAPNWFCSHWWGEAVLDFIKCCEKHAATHQLGADSAYWVCAYANRQHELGVDLGSDPIQSSFLKAMELSGGVLLILDPGATPFQRIWCCFEGGIVSLAQRDALPATSDCHGRETLQRLAARDGQEGRRSALQLDIATVDGDGTAQLITQRLTKQEEEMEEIRKLRGTQSGWAAKSEREKGFPIELVSKGLRVKITDGRASQVSDKTQILNALAGRQIDDLNSQPNCHHPTLRQVDTTLRGIFAVAAWRAALEQGLDTSEGSELPLEVALREDVSRRELELNLQGVAKQHDLSALCKAVEPLKNLTRWRLDLSNCQVTSIAELGRSLETFTNLQQLSVNLAMCNCLTSNAELGRSLGALTNLQQLNVDLAYCDDLTSIAELGRSLGALTNLQQLCVDLAWCTCLTSIAQLVRSLGALTNLQQLSVNLAGCKDLTSITGLGRSLEALTNLQQLSVDVACCRDLTSIAELVRSLRALTNLQQLSLNLAGCKDLTSITGLGRSLEALTNLQQLSVDLACCRDLTSIAELVRSLRALTNLQQLSLNLAGCRDLTSIANLGRSLERLTNLQQLSVNLACCDDLTSIAELGRSLGALTNLQQLCVDLSDCTGLTSIAELGRSLEGLTNLQELTVDLLRCEGLTSIAELGRSLGALTNLQQLTMNLAGCRDLTSIAELWGSLETLTNLQQLSVNLAMCNCLTSNAELGRSLGTLTNLQQLSVNLAYCDDLTSIAELGRSLGALTNLQQLCVDLAWCTCLISIAELVSSLEGLTNLQQLTVNLAMCTGLTSIAELGGGLEALTNLQKLTVILACCDGLTSIADLGRSLERLTNLQQLSVDLRRCSGLPPRLQCCFHFKAKLISALAADTGLLSNSSATTTTTTATD